MKYIILLIAILLSTNSYSQQDSTNGRGYYEYQAYKSYKSIGRDMEIMGITSTIIGLKVAWSPTMCQTLHQGASVLGLSAAIFLFGVFNETYAADRHLKRIIFAKGNTLNINLD